MGQLIRFVCKWTAVACVWGVIFGIGLLVWYGYDLPDVDGVKAPDRKPSITVLAKDDSVVAQYGGIKGDVLGVSELPKHTVDAFIAIEDRRFNSHFGIDPVGLGRAMVTNAMEMQFVQGGSTITQQLAKNLFLSPERTIRRKVQEAMLAIWLEQKYTKDEILTAYLNRVYFGAGAYGIDAASRTYFGKPATKLTLWESAILAGVLKAPSRYSPSSSPDLAAHRAELVLGAMLEMGMITPSQRRTPDGRKHYKVKRPSVTNPSRYFADWVVDRLDGFVGVTDKDIIVKTTLDPHLQKTADTSLASMLDTEGKERNVTQGAFVLMSYDGAVRAMTGGKDYAKSQFNRATQAYRQPGSSFKLFVYLAALEHGFRPRTRIEDAPIEVGTYRPANFDDKYYGTVTMAEAMAKSMNSVAVTLTREIGVRPVMDMAQRLGVLAKLRPDLSLALGTSEVTLLEMVSAFAVIANGGFDAWPYAITEIRDIDDNILYSRDAVAHLQLLSRGVANDMDHMLRGVVSVGTGRAANVSGDAVTGGKTGTSADFRDAWFVGYSGGLVGGAWMGNDDNAPMKKVTGGSMPARLFRTVLQDAVDTYGSRPHPALTVLRDRAPRGYDRGYNSRMAGGGRDRDSGGFAGVLRRLTGIDSDPRPSNVPVYNQ